MLEIKWFSPLEISSLVTAQVEPMWDLGREVAISKLCFCASITCITAFRWSHSGSTAQHLRTAKSHICPLNLIRWFLGSDYRTSRFHRNSQKRALKQSCRLGVQNKGLDAQRQIYTRKVRMLNPVSQFVEEVKGFDSGFFHASRQQYHYPDAQSAFWQKMSHSHLHSILISPRLLLSFGISGFGWEH